MRIHQPPSSSPPTQPTQRNRPPHPTTQQHELLLQHSAAFLQHLLPAYCAAIATPSESGDVRFFCLRMLSDALGACLADPDLYDASLSTAGATAGAAAAAGATGAGAAAGAAAAAGGKVDGAAGATATGATAGATAAGHGGSTAAVDALLRDHVLPLVPALLGQEDPMPLYALKVGAVMTDWMGRVRGWIRHQSALNHHLLPLPPHYPNPDPPTPTHQLLGGVLEVNSGFVGAVQSLGLAPLFFEYLSLEHANNNVHNIRLCRALVMAGGMGAAQLQALGAADKVRFGVVAPACLAGTYAGLIVLVLARPAGNSIRHSNHPN
jgi:serine/threonine-protein kinase ULK4